MRARIKKAVAAVAVVAVATTGLVAATPDAGRAASVPSLRAYGITSDGRLLLTWLTDSPGVNDWVRVVTGLTGDAYLVGMDFRPQDGKLYGLGNHGGVYTIGMPSAAAGEGVAAECESVGHDLRRGLQSGGEPAADRQRHGAEPQPQHRRRAPRPRRRCSRTPRPTGRRSA